MDPALVTLLVALLDGLAPIAALLKQHQAGVAVTPEQIKSLAETTKELLTQADALLNN